MRCCVETLQPQAAICYANSDICPGAFRQGRELGKQVSENKSVNIHVQPYCINHQYFLCPNANKNAFREHKCTHEFTLSRTREEIKQDGGNV